MWGLGATVRGWEVTLRGQIVGQWRTLGVTLEGTGGLWWEHWGAGDDAERDRLGGLWGWHWKGRFGGPWGWVVRAQGSCGEGTGGREEWN